MSEAKAEIQKLFAAYGAGFDDADAQAITDLFAYPATIWQFADGHIFEDEDDLAENVDALMDVFDQAEIVVTVPDVRDIRVAGATAFASVAWRQENSAGVPLHEFTCHYMLIRHDGEWRITTVVNDTAADDGRSPA